jgi:hypothetical protein
MPSNERTEHPSMKKGPEGGYQELRGATQEEVNSARLSFQRVSFQNLSPDWLLEAGPADPRFDLFLSRLL